MPVTSMSGTGGDERWSNNFYFSDNFYVVSRSFGCGSEPNAPTYSSTKINIRNKQQALQTLDQL